MEQDESGDNVAGTESWNGTNWTEVNDLNLARYQLNGAGIYTAVVAHGGYSTTTVEQIQNYGMVQTGLIKMLCLLLNKDKQE